MQALANTVRKPCTNCVGYNSDQLQTAGKFTTFMVPFNNVTDEDAGLNLTDITFTNLKTGTANGVADNVWVWSGIGWERYFFHSNKNWWTTGGTGTANKFDTKHPTGLAAGAALYFKAYAGDTVEKSMTCSGSVELEDEVEYELQTAGRFTFVGSPYPVSFDLDNPEHFTITNLKAGTANGVADNVWIWSGIGWERYFFHSSKNWWTTGGTTTANKFATKHPDGLKVGEALYFKAYAGDTAEKSIVFKKTF